MQNLLDPDVVNSVVAPYATYISLNGELKQSTPWAGMAHRPQAFLENPSRIFTRWDNQAFNLTTMFASGENVAGPSYWNS